MTGLRPGQDMCRSQIRRVGASWCSARRRRRCVAGSVDRPGPDRSL
jgi:hypothetical protein